MFTPALDTRESSGKTLARQKPESTVFSRLGRSLNGATTIRRAAEIILEAADEMLGWDAASLDLFLPESDLANCVLAMDLMQGRRAEVSPRDPETTPSPKMRQIICDGAQLILREGTPQFAPDAAPFGDTSRPSASLLFVPIRCEKRVTGVLTIQSYTPGAYSKADLNTLLALADHCGGAIQRIQSEGLLRRTEELYRRAIGGAGAVPYAYDYRTRAYSFIGEGIEELTGYSPQEINGELWFRIVRESAMTGEAAGLDKAEAARRVRSRRASPLALRHAHRHPGRQVALALRCLGANLDDAGRVIGSMGILEDITERKRAELSALALSKLGQNLLSATTQDEAARVARAGGQTNCSAGMPALSICIRRRRIRCIRCSTWTPSMASELKSRPRTRMASPRPVNRRVIENGAELILKEASDAAMDPEGTPFGDTSRPSASIMRVPVRLRTNKVTGIVSLHSYTPGAYSQKDLKTLQTLADCCGVALERIWADEALRQSESQFRLVWDSSGDGMRLTNREGIMLRVNDAYCRMVGKSRAELEGQLLTIVHSQANADFVLSTYQKRVDSNTLVPHLETEVTLWNGAKVWFELSNSLLEVPGKPPCVLSIFRDITPRKQTEAELAKMHGQLLEVSRQAGMAEVATSVLHNVGNVLNSVNVSSSLISDKVRASKVGNLAKAVALLRAHEHDLASFLTHDPKGRQLPGYLSSLAEHLAGEQEETLKEVDSLSGIH